MTIDTSPVWSGQWVTRHLGAELSPSLHDLVGLAVRRNPKRAHLLVSRVLGKHVPVDPARARAAGRELGRRVDVALGGRPAAILGLAETATALGHCVAAELGAPYLHSTRRSVATAVLLAAFEEEHSHATAHRLLPEDPAPWLDSDRVLVLVDDELSTGRTALNIISALHGVTPRAGYVIAALVDVRPTSELARLAAAAAELGTTIVTVALASGTLDLAPGFAARAAELDRAASTGHPPVKRTSAAPVTRSYGWPTGARESGRHGFDPADDLAATQAADRVVAALSDLTPGARILVLGTEELMYAPLLIAEALQAAGHPEVLISSTSRSPAVTVDDESYALRSALIFSALDTDDPAPRFAYNVVATGPYDDIVVVLDDEADTPALAGLLDALATSADRVHVVVVPTYRPLPAPLRSPEFGSYAAQEVAWLLSDLSGADLEAPVEQREEAIQAGRAHYAESLPVEYRPSAAYSALFEQALAESADEVALAVGTVTELVLAERGPAPVLASLARAGTPIGILMRRWAARRHGADLQHYTVSIVRGRGLDGTALRYLAARHDPADVVFVDGWTGKGAIARELAAAVARANAELGTEFVDDLAVLADPGSCVRTFGTREDFLIPSACLNSTVSGLVSRTVRNGRLLSPGQFDGAKFYADLADDDVSARYLDVITERFGPVAGAVDDAVARIRSGDREPTWSGWAAVEQLSREYGLDDVNLVKPGVGETTRVLLRRVPWLVLVRPGAAGLEHVRMLAGERGVDVREVARLPYRCVGLIHPRFTRAAVGADGRAASK